MCTPFLNRYDTVVILVDADVVELHQIIHELCHFLQWNYERDTQERPPNAHTHTKCPLGGGLELGHILFNGVTMNMFLVKNVCLTRT